MYLQFFEPHSALEEIVNNIIINQVDFDPLQPKPSFPFPPLPEHCHYGEFTTPDGRKAGNTDDMTTLVYVKKNGKWLLTAGENVPVDEKAKPYNPVKQMPKVSNTPLENSTNH